jgi:hypothetical protein
MSSDLRVLGENLGSCLESVDLLPSLKGLLWKRARMGGIRRGEMASIRRRSTHPERFRLFYNMVASQSSVLKDTQLPILNPPVNCQTGPIR